jgi:putative ubiquitin-RnfH superfamily antitoxin RatB of RatAB toxin-antitoxin module
MTAVLIDVEVVYASPDQQFRQCLCLPDGSTLWDALIASDVLAQTGQTWPLPVGVFAERVDDPQQYRLKTGDRVELYRPLTRDPKDVRRQRADRHPVGRRRSRRVPL